MTMSNNAMSNSATSNKATPMNNTAKAWARWQMPPMHTEPLCMPESQEASAYLTDEASSDARDEARRAGWEQGLSEGRMAARGELRLQAERLQQLIEQLAAPLSQSNDEVKEELVLLAMVIAKQVLHRELTLQPADIHEMVSQAIKALPAGTRHVRIHLHPEDAHLLSSNLEMNEGSTWKMIEDASIARGGCMVDSGASRIDARVETRLQDMLTRIQGHNSPRADVA